MLSVNGRENALVSVLFGFEEYRVTPFAPPLLPLGATSRHVFAYFPRRWVRSASTSSSSKCSPKLPIAAALEAPRKLDPDVPAWAIELSKLAHAIHVIDSSNGWGWLISLAYYVPLVGLLGQTLGMMIVDLRVVSDRFGRVGASRALLRCASLIGSLIGVIGSLKICSRVQPFEHWSRMRLVAGAGYLRSRERITAPSYDVVAQ